MKNNILVSICCVAYNHRNFIDDAIKSFLSQKVNFNFEILIHDDASTDGTTEIVKKYKEKYADIIQVFFQKENNFSKGHNPLFEILIPQAKGKYIALCEGDDRWIDEYKLQKQIDYLESHPDCSLCFTNGYNYFVEKGEYIEYINPKNFLIKEKYFTEDFLFENFVPTASMVFRKPLLSNLPHYYKNIPIGDRFLLVFFSTFGYLSLINDFTIIRNVHSGGITSIWHSNKDYNVFEVTYDYMNRFLEYKYNNLFELFKEYRKCFYLNEIDRFITEFLEYDWGVKLQSSPLSITILLEYLVMILDNKVKMVGSENLGLKQILYIANNYKFSIFGLGKSGKMTYEFVSKYFPESIKYFIDDNIKGEFNGIPIVTTDQFLKKYQDEVDVVVFGKYQHLNPKLIPNLKITYLRLENIL